MRVVEESSVTSVSGSGESKVFLIQTAGFSMRPFLKGTEKVIVKRAKVEDLKIGDIIAYRSNYFDQIVCHRLVKKVKEKEDFLLYTRGDASSGPDELINQDMFIGRVGIVLKGRKAVDLTGRWPSFINYLIVRAYPYVRVILKASRRIVSFVLELLQQNFLYRRIARFFLYDEVRCAKATTQEDGESFSNFYQASIPFNLVKAHTASDNKIPILYQFMAARKGRVIGAATLVEAEDKSPYPGWWVHGFRVLLRFGGVGIEGKLMKLMEDFVLDKGATKLCMAAKDEGVFSRRLYEKMGFKITGEKLLRFGSNSFHKRYYLMEKELRKAFS